MPVEIRPEVVPVLGKYHTSLSDLPGSDDSALANKIAAEWISSFSKALCSSDTAAILAHLVPDVPIWRDLLVLSWDFRTFTGLDAINSFLSQNLKNAGFTKLIPSPTIPADAMIVSPKPGEEIAWINVFGNFESAKGHGTLVARLIPTRKAAGGEVEWKAHGVFTDLDGLKDIRPQIGELRNAGPTFGGWEEKLAEDAKFENNDPAVVIIGGSQAGLAMAARLRAYGVRCLIVEKQPRLGDAWRNRYDALCLHDPVWYDHMPYLPFPPTWPVYCPARKLANWLESYASILELPVWLSTTAELVSRDPSGKGWMVDVNKDGTKRRLMTRHVVFAVGYGAGLPSIPTYPGQEEFAGEALHSSTHKTAKDHVGKKVAVIGSSTSGHDVAGDLAKHNVDVTMVQRSPTHIMSNESMRRALAAYSEDGPPTHVADLLTASMSAYLTIALSAGLTAYNMEQDKEMLDALAARGFRHFGGPQGTGFAGLLYQRGGGYYFNTGTSELIIDGSIKVKSDSPISGLTKTGLKFEDGSKLDVDAIIWATGYKPTEVGIKAMIKEGEADSLKPITFMNDEGESGPFWQGSGVKGLYVFGGNLMMGRYFSKHLTLRIKAIEEGRFEG